MNPAPPWLAATLRGLSPPPHVSPPVGEDLALLNLNECPWPPSPRAIAAADAAMRGANRYPSQAGDALTTALARRTGSDPHHVVLAGGSDFILHQACLVALQPGADCVFPRPSFPRYRLSTAIAGARGLAVDVTADGRNDVPGLLAAITAETRLVFACTPNGNTGGMLDNAELTALARGVPAGVLLCIDEAYAEFGRAAGGPDAIAVLRAQRRGPWLVSRTFSKAYALAGLRVGYAAGSGDDVAHAFAVSRPAFVLGGPAIAAAAAALDDDAHLALIVRRTAEGAAQLTAGLRGLGLAPYTSVANFVSADLRRPVTPVLAAMEAKGVFARGFREPGWDRQLRITVGTPQENARALAALAAALAMQPKELVA
jgi:histidinol-phosphate aminotransferase